MTKSTIISFCGHCLECSCKFWDKFLALKVSNSNQYNFKKNFLLKVSFHKLFLMSQFHFCLDGTISHIPITKLLFPYFLERKLCCLLIIKLKIEQIIKFQWYLGQVILIYILISSFVSVWCWLLLIGTNVLSVFFFLLDNHTF